MNRTPTPDGMFAPNFVGERWYFAECSPRNWQTVSSRRGRFIVPAYPYSPTKRVAEMCVRWCENTYSVMWICVCVETETRI